MIITLGDNYRVRTDRYNYILQERKEIDKNHRLASGDSDHRWDDIGYYGEFETLVNQMINKEIRDSDVNDLIELNNMVNSFIKTVSNDIGVVCLESKKKVKQ